MGLDVYLADGTTGTTKTYGEGEDAVTYTEYETRDYYLRSSYNESGFNQITEKMFGKYGYYYIFEPIIGGGQQYETAMTDPVALQEAYARAVEVLSWYTGSDGELFSCSTISTFQPDEQRPASGVQAMDLFRAERARWGGEYKEKMPGFSSYSNQDGYYFMEGFEIYGAFLGTSLSSPCVYLVWKMVPETLEHYTEAAQKAVELITEAQKMLAEGGRPVLQWSA